MRAKLRFEDDRATLGIAVARYREQGLFGRGGLHPKDGLRARPCYRKPRLTAEGRAMSHGRHVGAALCGCPSRIPPERCRFILIGELS